MPILVEIGSLDFEKILKRKWAHKTEIRQERWQIKKAEKLLTIHEWMRVFEFYSFKSIMEYRKIGKRLRKYISLLQTMILNRAIQSISYDNRQILLCFLRILLSLGLVSTNLKCVVNAFFKNELTASIKNMEKWPRDTQKIISLFYVWAENMLSPNF